MYKLLAYLKPFSHNTQRDRQRAIGIGCLSSSLERIVVYVHINKKPTNWQGQAKRCTTQLENLCRHSEFLSVICGGLAWPN